MSLEHFSNQRAGIPEAGEEFVVRIPSFRISAFYFGISRFRRMHP